MQLLALLPLASLALAQSSSSSSSASSSTTGTGAVATATVAVGQGGALRFIPEVINVQTGGKVIFNFFPNNHSVTQGDFNNPCQPSSNGINSGFVPVTNATVAQRSFTIDITNQDPIYIYCGQARHCQSGMAMSINVPATSQQVLSVYRNNAQNVSSAAVPATVRGGNLSGASTSTNGTTGTTNTTTGGGSSTSSKPAGSDAIKQSAGWVVALFAAVFAAVAIV